MELAIVERDPILVLDPSTDGEEDTYSPQPNPNVVRVLMTMHEARMLVKLSQNTQGTLLPQTVQVQTPWIPNIMSVVHQLAKALIPLDPSFDE